MVLVVHRRKAATAWTDTIGASKLLFGPESDITLNDGTVVRRLSQVVTEANIAAVPAAKPPVARRWLLTGPAQQHLPLWLRPSDVAAGAHVTEAVEVVGTRMPLRTTVDMSALGSAVHNCIAYYIASEGTATTDELKNVLARWRIGEAVEPAAVLSQAQALMRWVEAKWPAARVWTEVPVEVRLKSGRVVRGQIDLLVELGHGWVLIDHKSDPRSAAEGNRLAEEHGAQLDAYAQAVLEATGRDVVDRWLFLPVAAQAVRVGAAAIPALVSAAAANFSR
jgi:hypothetical protein